MFNSSSVSDVYKLKILKKAMSQDMHKDSVVSSR